ncbi:insulinase family protein [Pontimonas sp.]|nr:pitrilysin family protein [Pontimonas sp.]MDA8863380.1 insulinase family protein [Pontimonas sp.]
MSPAIEFDLQTPEMSFQASGDATVSRTIHPSGLRILSESVPGALSTSIGFWIAVGSRDEDSVAYGSTHFLEHLLFKGTPRRSALDIAIAFDQVGGEHNALTAKEHTCYYAKVQDQDLPMAIEVLADMVAASVIDASEFEVERQVILEELAMADDDPSDVAHERITETVLRDHPLGRPIGGNPDTIRASTRESVLEHYARYYRPHELVVTAAGAVDHKDLVKRVTQALSDAGWDLGVSSAPASRRGVAQAEIDRAPQSLVITRPLEQAVVALATHGIRATDERRPALSVLSSVLGGGMSSRLFQEIRERRGLAYSVYSFASAYADAGMFGMAAGTSPAHVAEVAGLMTTELSSIAHQGITAEELSRTRGNIAGASALALESSDARMMRLGRSELSTGEFVDRDEGLQRLSRVDLGDVQSLAQELLSTPLSAVVVGAVKDGIVDGVIEQDTIRSS